MKTSYFLYLLMLIIMAAVIAEARTDKNAMSIIQTKDLKSDIQNVKTSENFKIKNLPDNTIIVIKDEKAANKTRIAYRPDLKDSKESDTKEGIYSKSIHTITDTIIDPLTNGYISYPYPLYRQWNCSYPNQSIYIGGADALPDMSDFALLFQDGEVVFYHEDQIPFIQNNYVKDSGYKRMQTYGHTGITFLPSHYPAPIAVTDDTGIDFYNWDGTWVQRWVINAQTIIDIEYEKAHDRIFLSTKYGGINYLNLENLTITWWYTPRDTRMLEGIEFIDMENSPSTYDLIHTGKVIQRVELDGSAVNRPGEQFSTNLARGLVRIDGIAYTNNYIIGGSLLGLFIHNTSTLQRHFQIGSYFPEVKLMRPENNYTHNVSAPIVFWYNVSGSKQSANCSLLLNDSILQTVESPSINTALNFSVELDNGNYNWKIMCFDVAGDYGISETRLLIVDINNPPVLEPLEDVTLFESQLIEIQLNATDSDNDTLTFGTDAYEKITGAFSFDPVAGLFTWQPMPYESGIYVLAFNVTDDLSTDIENMTITIDIKPNCTNIVYHPETNPSQATMEERIKFCLDTGFWQSMNMGQLRYAGLIYEDNNFQWYGNCRDTTSDSWNDYPKYEIDLTECGMQPIVQECYDSDGGHNYTIAGRTGQTADGPFYDPDYCQQGGDINSPSMQYLVNSCNGTDCYLIENFCNLGYSKHEAYNCPNGCMNGACI